MRRRTAAALSVLTTAATLALSAPAGATTTAPATCAARLEQIGVNDAYYVFAYPHHAGRSLYGTLVATKGTRVTIDAVAGAYGETGFGDSPAGSRIFYRLKADPSLHIDSYYAGQVQPFAGGWIAVSYLRDRHKFSTCEAGLPYLDSNLQPVTTAVSRP